MCRDTAGTKRDYPDNPGCDVWHADFAGDSCYCVPPSTLGRFLLAALLHLGRRHSLSWTRQAPPPPSPISKLIAHSSFLCTAGAISGEKSGGVELNNYR